jgi:small subunit ribosomal protein S1
MVNRNLIRNLEFDHEIDSAFESAVSDILDPADLIDLISTEQDYEVNKIVDGRVIRVEEDCVLVDVGFKSEGTIPRHEWDEHEEPPSVGDIVKVLIEEMEDELGLADDPYGMVSLSRRKAQKLIEWDNVMNSVSEGQVVTGAVTRKIKGGLLVDIGVNVFLPASQVDIRRPPDIGDFIGRIVQCEVLKIDEARRNIVVSRRSLIEKQRKEDRERLLEELEEGQIRGGVVKNIAEFGAFVDLGGIDGLLHITDMSWERINHPSEMVALDQELDVVILNIDREKQKIALGLKQKQKNPWDTVVDKYPRAARITARW